MTQPDAVAQELAERLLHAHRRVRALDADPAVKARVARRLLAVSDASKHDVARAAARLDALLADLDDGRLPAADAEPGRP